MPKCISTKDRFPIRKNPNQFFTICANAVVVGAVESAAPSGDRTVDFDDIDAVVGVFVRNKRIVSGANCIARSIAPVDDDRAFASLDGEL